MSDIDQLTDEEAIALATLLGCEFFEPAIGEFYINAELSAARQHPLERYKLRYDSEFLKHGWPSRSALAREFLAWSLNQNER